VVNGAHYRTITGTTPEEAWSSIHVQQDSSFHRPIHPGSRLRTTGRVVQLRSTRAGALSVLKLETKDERSGEPVVTSWFSGIFLRIPLEGDGGVVEEPPALRDEAGLMVPVEAQVAIPIARSLPHVYTECAGIWNPIHTERRIAIDKALPDIILHGTCTWALAGMELIRRCAEGNSGRLKRLAGRFHGMVIPGSTVGLEFGRDPQQQAVVQFTVRNAEGALAVSHGVAHFD
jgi:acyl dehydratase